MEPGIVHCETTKSVMADRVEDRNLAARIRRRDPEAMAELYDRDGALVYTILLRIVRSVTVAEDLTQEVFLRVWISIESFDEQRGSLKRWVAVMARNKGVDYLRSPVGQMDKRSCELDAELPPVVKSGTEQELVTADLMRAAREGIALLPDRQQEVIRLAYFEGMTQAEIAKKIKVPLGTVKTWVRSGLASLRKHLIDQPEAALAGCEA